MEEVLQSERHRTWEEEMYWKHFKSMHFCSILPKDFHDQFVLPLKFAENMFTELPDKMPLIGPSGTVWEVTLMKTDNITFVGDGWKGFVKAYTLEVNCLLVFKYKRNFGFEVLIFDPTSSCEMESAYFVKKHEHTMSKHHAKEKMRVSYEAHSTEVVEEEDKDNDSDFVVSKKAKKDVEKLVCIGDRNHPQTPRKCSTYGVNKGSRGRGRPRKVGSHISDRNLKAKCGGRKAKENETAEKPHAPENGGGNDIGHSNESNESTGQTPNGNNAAEERNILHIGGSMVETVHAQKFRNTRGRPKKQLASVFSGKQVSDSGEKPNGNEDAKEQNSPEIGRNTLETVHSHKSSKIILRPKRRVTSKSSGELTFESDAAQRLPREYSSNRRSVTETEKENALRNAQKEQTQKSFIVVMRPTSVYRRFYLNVPIEWMHKYLPHRQQDVVLHVGEKTWLATFYYQNSQRGGGIRGAGWKKFVVENFLEEFDVCLFKLMNQKGDPAIVFDVDIFRVIPEIVPPSPVVTSPKA